jgi:penicillin amidase
VAHSAERLASTMTPMDDAMTIEEAFDAANGVGAPGQNMIVADRSGRIGWTVYGSIPRRVGIDGRLPASWASGTRGWSGWLSPSEYPRIIDPPGGRLWSANAREVGGRMLGVLGDNGYEMGSRAHIIRDRLSARDRFTARDLLAIQLDTGADFLARWRDLLLRTLTPQVISGSRGRTTFRDILQRGWNGHASPDSVAYRLTRMFREQATERVIASVLADCYEADATFDYRTIRQREGPIWALLTEQPMHLLDPQYASWNELILESVNEVIEDAERGHWFSGLGDRVWAEYNVTRYRHPLSGALPFLGRWLDMPPQALAGDLYTVNMHWQSNAPSERMVVSPGHEAEGIMNMPTGESGHPLSPYYANSHEAWVNGDPTPFLPGAAEHRLMLTP